MFRLTIVLVFLFFNVSLIHSNDPFLDGISSDQGTQYDSSSEPSSTNDPFIQAEQPDYITGYSCYWMGYRNGKWKWLSAPSYMFPSGSGFERCKQLDSCDGGDGMSGGGCYKWALSPKSPRIPWYIELNSNIFTLTNYEQGRVDELNARYRIELRQILGSDARVEQYMIEYR